MKKSIGHELVYPEGCREIGESLRPDELRRRLNEIIRKLEDMCNERQMSTDSLLNSTEMIDIVAADTCPPLNLKGLLMHLTSEMFIDHEDPDVQLRVAVSICTILKLYCPENPFQSFSDSTNRINVVLSFLLKCINEMAKLKSKTDKFFLNLYKIFSICCQTNLFHWFTICDNGETVLVDIFRTFFNIARRFSEWNGNNGDGGTQVCQMASDALVSLINQSCTGPVGVSSVVIPDKLVLYVMNTLADRCASREQRSLAVDIITRCSDKLDEHIQSILQTNLIKNELEDDLSESSDIDDGGDVEMDAEIDDFCSIDEMKSVTKNRKIESKKRTKEAGRKNSIETSAEYCCDHAFQLIYELFLINKSIVVPLLPSVEMKLKSANNVTDRKRACRLLGKLFVTFTPPLNNSSTSNNSGPQSTLWECFLGRFCDIDLSVREICIRVARDVLKRAAEGQDIEGGVLALPGARDDLVRALQKRSNDLEESLRFQLVVSVGQILDSSPGIVTESELESATANLLQIVLDRSRDKCMLVRKEANATLARMYRKIFSTSSDRSTFGLSGFSPGQRAKLETLLTQILRLYSRQEVEDKIVVERLFNTYLVPYNLDPLERMKALLQCFLLAEDTSLKSLQELFKTQVMVMNTLRETVYLIRDSHSEKVLSPSVFQKMKEKVKRLSEYLPNKDKMECLNKFFNLLRSDKKLYEVVLKLVNPNSSRDVIVKSISDIRRQFTTSKHPGTEPNPASIQKKKSFLSTVKCLLERSAPIIMDLVSGQELLSLLVSSKETLESAQNSSQEYITSIIRSLKLVHVISVIYRSSIPTQEAYEYIASIISQFDYNQTEPAVIEQEPVDDCKQSTPSSTNSVKSLISSAGIFNNNPTSIEEICLLTLGKIIGSRSIIESGYESEEEKSTNCNSDSSKNIGLFADETESMMSQTMKVVQYLMNCAVNGSVYPVSFAASQAAAKYKIKDRKNVPSISEDGDKEPCVWKYNARIAKLATKCLIGLYICCQHESRNESPTAHSLEILAILESKLDELVQNRNECELFSSKQTLMLSTLSQIGLYLRLKYGSEIHQYVENVVLMGILTSANESGNTSDQIAVPRNLSTWANNASVSVTTQVKIQALKMLSKWMVILKVDDDRNLIRSVIVCLKKYIGSFSNTQYNGNITDGDMAQMRLAAGKCWLRLAQVQSFLPIFMVKWLHRLSSLIYDPCPHVREGFLRKLHKGLFTLQLPLDYMAMFAFVPLVSVSEYLTMAKNYFSANVTRRREFLDRNPHYMNDPKLLFAVLPEYVLTFIIHMLAHDNHWSNVDDQSSIYRVKQSLWFVMEPILKLNENSSFIRKLLEKIKHAQDAVDPTNADLNEKLYICCDIALGLLISKQATYDYKEYPVELKLPRTRYIPAPNTFFNPDFANILLKDPPRVRIQFSPTHKSKQMIMNFMPTPLIKGHMLPPESNNKINDEVDSVLAKPTLVTTSSKPKKHVTKIVLGVPEIESEVVSIQNPPVEQFSTIQKKSPIRKSPTKRKLNTRNDSPVPELEEFESNPTSITKRGRICKPNVRVMKDMVSLSKKAPVIPVPSPVPEKQENSFDTNIVLESTISVNLERIQPSELFEKYETQTKNVSESPDNIDSKALKRKKSNIRKIAPKSPVSPKFVNVFKITRSQVTPSKSPKTPSNTPLEKKRKLNDSNNITQKTISSPTKRTRQSSNSTILNQLTKQVLTRKASSIRGVVQKKEKEKEKIIGKKNEKEKINEDKDKKKDEREKTNTEEQNKVDKSKKLDRKVKIKEKDQKDKDEKDRKKQNNQTKKDEKDKKKEENQSEKDKKDKNGKEKNQTEKDIKGKNIVKKKDKESPKSPTSKSIILQAESPTKVSTPRTRSSQSSQVNRRGRKSIEISQKSSNGEIVSRSKRVASRLATHSLMLIRSPRTSNNQ